MKTIIITILTVTLSFSTLTAQSFEGIATYKTDRKIDLKMDSTMAGSGMQEQLMAQLRKQFQREYNLSFNKDESLYAQVENLDAPAPAASAGGVNIVLSGNTDILYRNASDQTFVNQTEIMGKEFLIQDKIEKRDWKLEKGTKNIGEYTCFKATLTEEITDETFDSATDSIVKVERTRVTTAWYTLDIPVPHGPGNFTGLPGLVLEVNDGDQSILCSRIVLNPEKAINIKAPNKGKKVTQSEYDAIQEKKMAEMREQFQSDGRRGGDSHRMQIRIGG